MKPIMFALPFVSAHGYLEDPPGRNLVSVDGPNCLYPKDLAKDYNKHGIFREWPEGGSTGEINKRGKKDDNNDLKVHELGEACGAGIKDSKVPYNKFKVNQFGISKYVKPNSPAEVTVKLTAPKQGHVWFDFACFDGNTDKFSHDKSVSWKRLEHADGSGSVSTTKSGVNDLKVKLKMPGECGHGVLQWTWWAEHKNPVENFFNCADIKITNAAQPATLPCAGKGEEPAASGGSPAAEGEGSPPDSAGGENPPDSAGGNPPDSAGGENPPDSAGGENPPDSAGGGGEGKKFSLNLIIGIVIAGVVVIALVGLVIYWKKSNNQSPNVPPPRPTNNFQPGRRRNNQGNYARRRR